MAPAVNSVFVTTPSPSVSNVFNSVSARAETVLKTFDTDGDGVVTKTEFTTGAMEVLKRASVQFHHQRVGQKGTSVGQA